MAAPYSAKAATLRARPTTCCGVRAVPAGLPAAAFTIPTPTAPAVPLLGHRRQSAKGYSLEQSVERAKDYVSGALEAMLDLGKGSGPLDHTFCLANPYTAYPQEI